MCLERLITQLFMLFLIFLLQNYVFEQSQNENINEKRFGECNKDSHW